MKRRPHHSMSILLGLFLLQVACGGPAGDVTKERRQRATSGEGELVVGVVWPWEARRELRYREGLDLAVDEINQAGGIHGRKLRLLPADDHESVNEGRLAAQRLASDPDVVAIVGHLQSHVTVPAAAIYDLAGLVLVAPAATSADLTTKGYSRVFRATFTDRDVGEQMAAYAAEQGYRRVAIFYVRSIYGRALANAFEETLAGTGVVVVARDSYDSGPDVGQGALDPLLSRWKHLDIDSVFFAGEVPSAGALISQLRSGGIEAPILGGDAMSSPSLIAVGGEATEGTVVASFFHPNEPREAVRDFVRTFTERYGASPDAGSALGYDSIKLLAEAMRRAEVPAPLEIARAMRSLKDWPGVTGNFTFDDKGNLLRREMLRTVVQSGRFEYLSRTAGSALANQELDKRPAAGSRRKEALGLSKASAGGE